MTESEHQLEILIDLERARILERELRLESESLLSGLSTLSRINSPDELFTELIEVLRPLFEFEDAFILDSTDNSAMKVVATTKIAFSSTQWIPQSLFKRVLKGEPVAVFDISKVKEWRNFSTELSCNIKSALHVPLSKKPQAAILVCTHSSPHFFGPKHINIARRFAPFTAQAFSSLELKRSIAERDRLFTLSLDMMGISSYNGYFKQLNSAWEKTLGYTTAELTSKRFLNFVMPEDRHKVIKAFRSLVTGNEKEYFEIRCITKQGEKKWLRCSVGTCTEDQLCYIVARDVTNPVLVRQKLSYEANHDSLTGLSNRKLIMEKLSYAVAKTKTDRDYKFAVLFLDLDRFKIINDSLGHIVGDDLLKEVSRRLHSVIEQHHTVARLGGDEFLILLENILDTNDAVETVKAIQNQLKLPIHLSGYNIVSTVSIGITTSAIDYQNAAEVLRDADIAMYWAKGNGKSCFSVFNKNMHSKIVSQLQIETDLRNAISKKELEIFFQPIVDLNTYQIRGLEALLRWHHPINGLLNAQQFIPVAEESVLILLIGDWVLQEVCRHIEKWHHHFSNKHPLYISVNVSAKQFWQKDLLSDITQLLQNHELQPCSLKLEITESVFMDNRLNSVDMLHALKAVGIGLFVDDFGTGYSSLSYLHRFPFDVLKVDQSFIHRMETDQASLDLVVAIIQLGKNLGLRIIAEGIETSSQMKQLNTLGCECGQGFLFSKPICASDVESLLQNHKKSFRWF